MMRRPRCVAVALAFVSCAACVSHPVGPARTYGKYEGKAVTSVEGVLSAVETVRMAAQAGSKGNAFGPYLSILISESEDSVSGVQGTFDSIQPPSAAGDHLKGEVDDLFGDALDHVTQLRVIVRRGRIADLADAASDLADDSKKLNEFIEAHKS